MEWIVISRVYILLIPVGKLRRCVRIIRWVIIRVMTVIIGSVKEKVFSGVIMVHSVPDGRRCCTVLETVYPMNWMWHHRCKAFIRRENGSIQRKMISRTGIVTRRWSWYTNRIVSNSGCNQTNAASDCQNCVPDTNQRVWIYGEFPFWNKKWMPYVPESHKGEFHKIYRNLLFPDMDALFWKHFGYAVYLSPQ